MSFYLRRTLNADWRRLQDVSGSKKTTLKFKHYFSPRFAPVVIVRLSHALTIRGYHRMAKFMSLINFTVFGLEVPSTLEIGPGLVLPHTQGTILGAAKIGHNATIFQQVTIGATDLDFFFNPSVRPIIGDNVKIGAGAKILGGITIGNSCTIGANAVVLMDTPEDSTAVGVPAVLVKY